MPVAARRPLRAGAGWQASVRARVAPGLAHRANLRLENTSIWVENGGMTPNAGHDRVAALLAALGEYRAARERLLAVLGPRKSNRDPLAEFTEHFAAALMGGRLAGSPVQASWDIELPDGAKVQAKYLVNSASPATGAWVNEHLVHSQPGVDWYALVIIEGFQVSGVAAFPARLGLICQALGKRHDNQDTTLQFGRRNWLTISDDPDRFRGLGMRVWLPPFNSAGGRR